MRRLIVSLALLIVASSTLVYTGAALLVFQQVLPKPGNVQTPSVTSLCPAVTNMTLVTDPNPLRTSFPSGNNGTAIYGCALSGTGVTASVGITGSGTITPTFNLPTTIQLYLIPVTSGSVGPLSQSQCASQGVLLTSASPLSVTAGNFAYCESFSDAGLLQQVTVSWSQ